MSLDEAARQHLDGALHRVDDREYQPEYKRRKL